MFFSIHPDEAKTFHTWLRFPRYWLLILDHRRAKFKQRHTVKQTQVVFINHSQAITCQYNIRGVMCVSVTDDYPKPSAFLCDDFTNSVCGSHTSEWFIYSCKSCFKWLTSKLLVYRAKWRAASPFQGSPVLFFLVVVFLISLPNPPWTETQSEGEFNLYEKNQRSAKKPTVGYKEVLPHFALPFLSLSIPQHLKREKLWIVVIMVLLLNIHLTHQ